MARTTVVGTRVSVMALARIYRWLKETGQYTKASPGGVTRRALEVLDWLLLSKGIGEDIVDEDQAEMILGAIMMTGLDWQEKRPAVSLGDGIDGLERKRGGVPAYGKDVDKVKEDAAAMVADWIARYGEGEAQEPVKPTREEVSAAKDAGIARARAQGMIVSDDTRSAEEISEERAAIDAERMQKEKENMLAVAKSAKRGIVEVDDLAEFNALADDIVAKQPYVRNVELPAPTVPGVVETQEELRKV